MSVITKTLKFTGGMLLGLGVGAVTAVLLAPQSGELSRNQLQARLNAVLAAGREAQQATETELQARWETTVHEAGKGDAPVPSPEEARKSKAAEAEERARQKADAERKDAARHLERAGKELDKARTKI